MDASPTRHMQAFVPSTSTMAHLPLPHDMLPFYCLLCRHMLSLYAHVSRMVFDNATLGTPVLKATISNSATGDITAVSVDVRKEPAATTADRIWELIAG